MKIANLTPHNSAAVGDFAKTVLMPGDPLRSQFIAENFLESPKLVNNVRGIQGYTGLYKGKPVSVMASGMGMPSIGIYAYELFNIYNVDNIIRIGSAGSIQNDINIGDIVIGLGACTNSNFAAQYQLPGSFAPICSYDLLKKCVHSFRRLVSADQDFRVEIHIGNLLSSDTFYADNSKTANEAWSKMGVMAIEMEAAALYMTAARCNRNALSICTISDHVLLGGEMTPEERQTSLKDMIILALETAILP